MQQQAMAANAVAAGITADTAETAHRVLFITMHFPPSRDIGAHACEQIARYFPLYGWEPVILTRPKRFIESLDPNHTRSFPGKIVEAAPLPHPLDLYRRLKPSRYGGDGRKSGDGLPAGQRQGHIRRWILSLLHTPDPYLGWLLPATIAGLRAIRRERIAHIISSGPYWTNHLTGLLLSACTGLPWTTHYRDPWNQVPQAKPVSSLSAKLERWLEGLVIRRATSVVCVTERHAQILRDTFAIEPAKIVAIPNGYDGGEWEDIAAGRNSKFVISYPGGFALGTRTPRPLFRALRSLIDAGEIDPAQLHVDLFGNCELAEGMRVTDIAAEYGLTDVVTVGPSRGRAETLRRMAQSDLLLLLAEGWDLQIPGKTYEYLRSGRRILALTSEGALADLLRQTGGASVAEPHDDDAIRAAILDAWTHREESTPRNAPLIESFDRRRLAGRYAALFSRSLNSRSESRRR